MSDIEPKEKLFYVQDTRQYVGNCVLWWGKNRSGYTTELDKAGLYTEKDLRSMRVTDIGWPQEYVEARVTRHVRAEPLHENNWHKVRVVGGRNDS